MTAYLNRVPHCPGDYDFNGLGLDEEDRELISSHFKERLLNDEDDYLFRSDVWLPVLWAKYGHDGIGGPPVEDALTLYVSLPGSDEPVTFETTLRAVIMDAISDEGDFVTYPRTRDRLVKALRDLAAEIQAIPLDETTETD